MKKALLVGINNYPSAPLRGCRNDAIKMAELLRKNDDGSPNFDVRLELDVPTRAKLKSLIVELFSGHPDTVVFYFSGHGHMNQFGGYLVTPDYEKYDEGISMDDILLLANESQVNDRVIILDCCHSGAFGSSRSTSTSATIGNGVSILTASRADEPSLEINGHGVFTSLLLDALSGGAADLRGNVTPGGVYAYVDQALGAWDQRPVFRTNVSRFTTLRECKPQVPADVLRKMTKYFPDQNREFSLDPSFEETNTESIPHSVIDPRSNPDNVKVFKHLQMMQSVGLIVPNGAPFMYFAAMNSKSCSLTALGKHYWRLVRDGYI